MLRTWPQEGEQVPVSASSSSAAREAFRMSRPSGCLAKAETQRNKKPKTCPRLFPESCRGGARTRRRLHGSVLSLGCSFCHRVSRLPSDAE